MVRPAPRAPPNAVEKNCNCASHDPLPEDGELTAAPRPTINYSQIASSTPSRTYKTKYSRLGSQLQLNYGEMCPHGSLMLDESNPSSFAPEHLNCPSLFIVGARKAGTTSLYMYISRHPSFKGILLDKGPRAGETFYFSSRWTSWQWSQYMSLFQHTSHYMTGESSVGYLVHCRVPERVWRSCGKQAKIVILLRDPIKRLESNFHMRVRVKSRGYSNTTKAATMVKFELEKFLKTALKKSADMKRIEKSWEKFCCLFNPSNNMVFEGLYYVHLMNWLCNFPPENILILNSEEFFNHTPAVLEDVIEFLGLPPLDTNTTAFITSTAYNTDRGGYGQRQQLSKNDVKKLKAVYKNANEPLLNLLGWESLDWT